MRIPIAHRSVFPIIAVILAALVATAAPAAAKQEVIVFHAGSLTVPLAHGTPRPRFRCLSGSWK